MERAQRERAEGIYSFWGPAGGALRDLLPEGPLELRKVDKSSTGGPLLLLGAGTGSREGAGGPGGAESHKRSL